MLYLQNWRRSKYTNLFSHYALKWEITKGVPKLLSPASLQARNVIYQETKYVGMKCTSKQIESLPKTTITNQATLVNSWNDPSKNSKHLLKINWYVTKYMLFVLAVVRGAVEFFFSKYQPSFWIHHCHLSSHFVKMIFAYFVLANVWKCVWMSVFTSCIVLNHWLHNVFFSSGISQKSHGAKTGL